MDTIHIVVRDNMSNCQAIDIVMSLEDFGKAIMGLTGVPCDFEFNDSDLIGKKKEIKYELLPKIDVDIFVDRDSLLKQYKREILPECEVDGWRVRESDLFNHHNWRGNKVRVLFERPVDEKDIKEEEQCQ